MKIGFIGLGHMGSGMAANLLKASHEVTVYNRTAGKVQALVEQGAHGEKLIGLGIGGGVDERAESGAKVHPALALHALQRLPNRLPADPELGGQLVFDQVRTRLQLTTDDHFDENVVHRLPQRCRTLQWSADG